MGKKLHNKGPKKGAKKEPKTKPMSSKHLWRFSRFNYGLGSVQPCVQPWELWQDYEAARRAWKKMSPGRARNMAKRKAKAALILGLWEIDHIEKNRRLEEEAERKRLLALFKDYADPRAHPRDNKKQADYEDPMDNKKDAEPAPPGNLEPGPDLTDFK